MILLSTIILIVLAAVLLGWMIFIYSFTRQLMATFLRGEAPFVPTRAGVLPEIAQNIRLSENSVLFDLGSGDARILVACHQSQPKSQCVGFEKSAIPFFWAKLRLWKMGLAKKIRIHKKDFFEADFSEATHIFCYLVPKQMEKLGPKLKREIENGKKVLSLGFELPNVSPREKILLGKENLYIYEKLPKS